MGITRREDIKIEDLPKAFMVEKENQHLFDPQTPALGFILLQKDEILFQIEDDKMYYSNGICDLDVRHLLARPDLFTPCDYNKLQQIEKL